MTQETASLLIHLTIYQISVFNGNGIHDPTKRIYRVESRFQPQDCDSMQNSCSDGKVMEHMGIPVKCQINYYPTIHNDSKR